MRFRSKKLNVKLKRKDRALDNVYWNKIIAIRISSTLRVTLSRSVNVSIRAARIEIEETVRMSCMYCGRMMLEIKLRAVLMLSKCQVSSFLYKVNSE